MYSLLNDVFRTATYTRPLVYVVSDEVLKDYQKKQQDRTLKAIDERIEDLQTYRKSVEESFLALEQPTTEDEGK